MKLTNKAIRSFAYHGGWDVRWDDQVTGFGVRVYPPVKDSGQSKKAFVLSYRHQKRKRLMVLGRYGVMTVDEARRKASKHLVGLSEGKDPLEERRRATLGKTFGDLAVAYMERHARIHKRSWRDDERRLKQCVPAGWRRRRADSISRSEISALHAEVGKTAPYDANRLLSLLRLMFRLAEEWGFVEEGARNPAAGVKRFREHARHRWVTPEELPALAQAIDAEPNIYVRAAIWLLLLSGLRKNELLRGRREDVDWTRGVLRLRETKAGGEQFATLNAPALAILQAVPAVEGNPYLLPGAKVSHHLVNIDKPWRNIRRRAGIADVRLHDLRRTVGSWLSQSGVDLNLIKDALRHSDLSTTLVYSRLGQDPAREAMEAHGRRILEAAGRLGPRAVVDGGASEE